MPATEPHLPNTGKPTVYYDGACPMCRAEIGHYRALPGAETLRFVDCAAPGAALGADLCRDQALARFHVRRADGSLVSGARAFVEVWRALPRWRWAAQLASIPGAPMLLEAAYRLSLRVRPLLTRRLRSR